MENKTLGLLVFGILALIVLTSFASAVVTLTLTDSPDTLTKFVSSTNFTITASPNVNFLTTFPQTLIIKDANNNEVSLQITNTSVLTGVSSATFSVTVNSVSANFNLGKYSNTLTINTENVSDPLDTKTIDVPISFENTPNEFTNPNGNLKIDSVDLSVEKGFGSDNEWYPLDEITAKIDVSNNGDEKVKSIEVQWGLYDTENGKWITSKGKEDSFSLSSGDDKIITVNFKLDKLSRIDTENTGNYKFYAWATGKDEAVNGVEISDYNSEDITLNIESDFVVLDNIQIPESASCNEQIQIIADIWNIGSDSQDNVYVIISSQELNLNQEIPIGDIDSFEDGKLDARITIPKDAEEKYSTLKFSVYNEDDEVYQNSNDDESVFSFPIQIKGCLIASPVSVSANLESGGKAGEEMVVKATIVNNGNTLATYNLQAKGYENWASLKSTNPQSVILSAGESKEVLLAFNVDEGVSGENTFSLDVLSDGKLVTEQPVSVTIEGSSGLPFSGILGNVLGGGNNLLWGIGALNVILVIIIIFMALRVAKK